MLSGANAISTNEAFWEKAYSENFAALCSRASRLLTSGNVAEAEDTVSEAFLRGIRYAQKPEEIRNVVSYLWTTVKRVWSAQQVRLSTARTEHLEDMAAEEIESMAAVQVVPEIQTFLQDEAALIAFRLKLGPLSMAESTLVELRRQGYKFEEIAKLLGENVKLTRFRWQKFIARQRKRLTVNQIAA